MKPRIKMIDVGFITNNHYPRLGGMEYVTHFMAQSLNDLKDVNASVACHTLRDVPKQYQYPYTCYRAKSLSFLTPWLIRRNQMKMIKQEKINVLHGQMLLSGGFDAMTLSKVFNIPFVAQSHGADVQFVNEIKYGAVLQQEKKDRIKQVISRANKIIAVSSINKQHIIDLGASPENVEIIHNAVHLNKINNIKYENLRKVWKVKDDDFVLITVGRNRPVKRMELLFAALEKLKEFTKIKCVCIGPISNLKELVQKHGLQDQVELMGEIPLKTNFNLHPPYPDLINAYKSANLYISTSYVESFGMAAAEALACGTPIIYGQNHGIKDIVINDVTGWVMPKETPEGLAELILFLFNKKEELEANREAIVRSVSYLSWESSAKKALKIYNSII